MGRPFKPDAGLALALAAAGGQRPLARRTGLALGKIQHWTRVPQPHLLHVARATGLEPEELRPDLAAWIERERMRRIMLRARERFAIAAAAAAGSSELPGEAEMLGLLHTLAAARFASQARGVQFERILFGPNRPEESARAYAMALAVNVARVSSTAVAGVYGCSRQNVDNASLRYLRARDGDDLDDAEIGDDGAARVIERGRLRRAKEGGDAALWQAEQRFAAVIEGGKA